MIEHTITAKSSESISALDPNKIVITKGKKVFDDSVIAIEADYAAAELPKELKAALKERKKISIEIQCAGLSDRVEAFGAYKLKLTDKNNIIITKSDFIDSATAGVRSNKGAADLDRDLVRTLTLGQEVKIILRVKP